MWVSKLVWDLRLMIDLLILRPLYRLFKAGAHVSWRCRNHRFQIQ